MAAMMRVFDSVVCRLARLALLLRRVRFAWEEPWLVHDVDLGLFIFCRSVTTLRDNRAKFYDKQSPPNRQPVRRGYETSDGGAGWHVCATCSAS